MGKIKNWIKTADRKDLKAWRNKQKGRYGATVIQIKKVMPQFKGLKEYRVILHVPDSNPKDIGDDRYTNYKDAHAFAVKYMKKHPNGW